MKFFFTSFLLCFLQTILLAQNPEICDTIVLKDGRTILAVITKSNDSELYYQKCGVPETTERMLSKAYVKEIRTRTGVKNPSGKPLKPLETDTVQLWHITTVDGNDYIGAIVSQDETKIVINSNVLGTISLPKAQIKLMEPVKREQVINGTFWYESPHSTRYFWAPNGYGLKKGEGYYQNTWILLNQASYGFSNYFSIGAGLVPTFLFGAETFPFWITPKFSIPLQKDKINLGLGVIYINALGTDREEVGSAGITYGVLSFGPRDRNMTFGMGYGFVGGDWAKNPMVTLSGMYRVRRKFTLLTENYWIPVAGDESFGLISAGARYGGKGLAIDFGLFAPITQYDGFFIALPWLGINVPFGKARK